MKTLKFILITIFICLTNLCVVSQEVDYYCKFNNDRYYTLDTIELLDSVNINYSDYQKYKENRKKFDIITNQDKFYEITNLKNNNIDFEKFNVFVAIIDFRSYMSPIIKISLIWDTINNENIVSIEIYGDGILVGKSEPEYFIFLISKEFCRNLQKICYSYKYFTNENKKNYINHNISSTNNKHFNRAGKLRRNTHNVFK